MQKNSSDDPMGPPFTPHGHYRFPPIEPDEFDLFLAQQPDKPPPSPRIPTEKDNVQLNFCKSPTCANYGIPPS